MSICCDEKTLTLIAYFMENKKGPAMRTPFDNSFKTSLIEELP